MVAKPIVTKTPTATPNVTIRTINLPRHKSVSLVMIPTKTETKLAIILKEIKETDSSRKYVSFVTYDPQLNMPDDIQYITEGIYAENVPVIDISDA
jgi:hypothetical protein